jgi:hypothetical protein
MPDETPPRAADAKPAPEEPVTNSEDAQEAVDVYLAGVANTNPDPELVAKADAEEAKAAEQAEKQAEKAAKAEAAAQKAEKAE